MGSLPRPTNNRFPVDPIKSSILADSTNRQLNHSPVESPPTVKKKLCRLAKGLLESSGHQKALEGLDAAFIHDAPAVEIAQIALGTIPASLKNRPRLERSNSLTTRGTSILKKQKTFRASIRAKSTQSWPPHKGVKFLEEVTVIRIDDDGSYVCTECDKLHEAAVQPREIPPSGHYSLMRHPLTGLRRDSLTRSNAIRLVRSPSEPAPATVSPQPPTQIDPTLRTQAVITPWSPDEKSSAPSKVNFTFIEDPLHGLKLKFVVPLGSGFGPSDIVVKANMSGNRIRVVANRPSSPLEPFNERYPLPMDVDPYMVTARLDIKGQLIVEAPLMTLARRNSLDSGRQRNSQAAEQAFAI